MRSDVVNAHFKYLICILFWLVNNKKCKYPEFCIRYSDETWYVGKGGLKFPLGCWMHKIDVSFAYLFWLADNKKDKYPEDFMN